MHSSPQHKIPDSSALKRGSSGAFEALALNARFRGHDEKPPIIYANFCKKVLGPRERSWRCAATTRLAAVEVSEVYKQELPFALVEEAQKSDCVLKPTRISRNVG